MMTQEEIQVANLKTDLAVLREGLAKEKIKTVIFEQGLTELAYSQATSVEFYRDIAKVFLIKGRKPWL